MMISIRVDIGIHHAGINEINVDLILNDLETRLDFKLDFKLDLFYRVFSRIMRAINLSANEFLLKEVKCIGRSNCDVTTVRG